MTMDQPTPADRSTEFRAVEGNPTEQYSGGVLLVTAYAALWTIIFVWIAIVWRRQASIRSRLVDLERVIDKAAASAGAHGAGVESKGSAAPAERAAMGR